MRRAGPIAIARSADAGREIAIPLTEDMYGAIFGELAHRRVSRELQRNIDHAMALELTRPWPERLYVVTCSRRACAELRGHVEKALGHTAGVRRGALSRGLVRIADAELAATGSGPQGRPG